MNMQVYQSRGKEYVRIIESFRDPQTKKPKVRVLENFGNKEELLASNPHALEEIEAKVQRMRAEKQDYYRTEVQEQVDTFTKNESSSLEEQPGAAIKNYGYEVYKHLWDELKLDYFFTYRQKRHTQMQFASKHPIALMTYSRLLYPDSKRSTYEGKERFAGEFSCTLDHLYRSLGFLAEQKEHLEKHLHKQLSMQADRQLAVAFYDVTTYYFESVQADTLKKFGFSKDNKVNQVQVVMGLLIDEHGIPVSYDLFPGNTSDFRTLEPALNRVKAQYGITKLILVADRGLNSKRNLALLKSLGFEYIMGYKIRSGSKKAKEMVLDPQGYTSESAHFKWKKCDFTSTFRENGQTHTLEDHLLLTWSQKRQHKDRADRERIVAKSKKLVESKSNMKAEMKKGGKKYIQLTLMDEDQISFNEEQLEVDEAFDGYYGIQYSDASLSSEEILEAYHGLWKIEESFRVLKSNFEARPIYVWTEESIRGHFAVCYLALVLQRLLEHRLKQAGVEDSTASIQEAVRSATFSQLSMNNSEMYIKHEPDPLFHQACNVLGLPTLPTYGRVNQKSHAYIQPKK